MDRDSEDDDRASRGRRIFEALRKRTEDALVSSPAPTITAVDEPPEAERAPDAGAANEADSPSEKNPSAAPTVSTGLREDAAESEDEPQGGAAADADSPFETEPSASPAAWIDRTEPEPEPEPDSDDEPQAGPAADAESPFEAEPSAPPAAWIDRTEPEPEPDEAPSATDPPPRPLPGAEALESQLEAPPPPVMTPPPTTVPAAPPTPVPPPPSVTVAPVEAPVTPAEVAEAEQETEPISEKPAAPREPVLPLPRVIAVANQKGGVGKTTTAVNLGAALAELDFRVLVVDLDPQGNATTGMGIDIRNLDTTVYGALMADTPLEDCIEATSVRNLFVAPSNMDLAGAEIELVPMFSRELKLRRAIDTVKDDYDFILIDCPPSLGLLTVNGLASAEDVIVPIQCEYYALEGLGQLVNNVNLVRANLNPVLDIRGIVLTMYDARTNLADQVVAEVRRHFGAKVFQTVVPRTVRLSEAPSFGQPIIVFDSHSRGSSAYRGLARELAARVEGGLARVQAWDDDHQVSS